MNPVSGESIQLTVRERRDRAIQHAAMSVLVPGLGQCAQGRWGAALVQLGTVAGYLTGVLGLGARWALPLALLWNLWSIIDAY